MRLFARGRPARRLHHLLGLQPRNLPDDRARRARPPPLYVGASVIGSIALLFARPAGDAGARHERRPGPHLHRRAPRMTASGSTAGSSATCRRSSFSQVSRWARTGQLRLDGKRATPGDRIEAGQTIRVPPQARKRRRRRSRRRERPTLSDDEIEFVRALVIHETPRRSSSTSRPASPPRAAPRPRTISTACSTGSPTKARPRPKLVHRLDKDTSGALLVARTPRAAAFFSKSFSGRTARKVYWALVVGVPSIDDGMIELPLAKQPGTGRREDACRREGRAAGADPLSRDRAAGNRAAWVELQPFTGRTHQLRVHMAAIGHPIVGDGKYGGPGRLPDRIDQPQAAPPCPAPADRSSRRRPDRRDRRAARPFRGEHGARWASTSRSATCRSTRSSSPKRPKASARPRPPPPRPAARSARASAARAGAS